MALIRKKYGYIANKIGIEEDENNGNEIEIFDKPFLFKELYMPLSDDLDLENYGNDVNRILRMFVNVNEWYGRIHVGDRAYLIDEKTCECDIDKMAESDNKYCNNANYKVDVVAVQNFKLKVQFKKIGEGD